MSTNREDLHRLTDELPEDVAGVVLQFARAALAKDAEGERYLAGIAADPERLAHFRAAIDVGLEQAERGEGQPASDVFADLRPRAEVLHAGPSPHHARLPRLPVSCADPSGGWPRA